MKLYLTLALIVIFSLKMLAQQRVQFSQYMVNQYILNPAVGGTNGDLDLTVGYRKQWVNFNGGPVSYYLSGNAPLHVNRKPGVKKSVPIHAIGGIAFNDKTGPISKTTIMGSYTYNFPIYKDVRLAAGTFLGVTEVKLDVSEISFDQPGEEMNLVSKKVPDASFGLWVYNEQFFTGVSINQLFKQAINFIDVDNSLGKLNHHYYLTAGYKIPLWQQQSPEVKHYLVPSFMLKQATNAALPSIDLNMKFHFYKNYWIGSSYRNLDSFILLAGIRFNTDDVGVFDLAYSYDYTVSKINYYTSGSHEITLKYTFNLKPETCPKSFW